MALMPSPEQLEALEQIAAAAVASESICEMPAELTTAQCILESKWLTVCPGNNCFGIKATDSSETYQFTHEYVNGQWQEEKLAFEAYPTLAACFTAHARLLQGGRYEEAWLAYDLGSLNLDGFIAAIAPIYASGPAYAAEVTELAHGPHVTDAINRARAVVG